MDTTPSRSALIVIDLQRALFSGASQPYDGIQVLQRIQTLIAQARSAKAPVIFVQHCSAKGTSCEKGSRGWELMDEIVPDAGELLIEKYRPSIFFGTPLLQYLRGAGVGRVVLVGMKTEYCIDTSCRAASELGFRVVLPSDGHTTVDSPLLPAESIIAHHNLTLGGPFAELYPASEVSFA